MAGHWSKHYPDIAQRMRAMSEWVAGHIEHGVKPNHNGKVLELVPKR